MAVLTQIAAGSTTYDISDASARTTINNYCITVSQNLTSLPANISNAKITADMVVASVTFGTPSNVGGDISWTTSSGKLALSGTLNGQTTATFVLCKANLSQI